MPLLRMSRRRFLLAAPPVLALWGCSPPASRPIVNVRDHGAVGDGTIDDSAAITAAVAALATGSVLHFPSGRYRFAERNPSSAAAISVAGLSDIDIDFAPDAELVMDNVDPRTNTGTSHGILIRGPAAGITLRNVHIRWTQQTRRSMGDGIRIVGFPDDVGAAPDGWSGPAAPVSGVTLSNCLIQSAPQAGVVMIGVSDVTVTDSRAENTQADGLHFNACRRGTVSGHTAVNTGDDGLALVTYFSDKYSFDPAAEMFAFPELTEWSNTDFTVENVMVSGGQANGVRLAGAQRVSINGLKVTEVQHGSAVMVDSATAGHDVEWEYVATRGLRVAGLTAQDCETGIHVLARPPESVDPRFTDFGVDIADARLLRCTNWSVRVESLSDQRATGVSLDRCLVDATSAAGGNGGVGLSSTQGVHLGRISIIHAQAVTIFAAADTGLLTVDDLELTLTQPNGSDDAASCARFVNTDGAIETMALRWPAAPPAWKPVLLEPVSACDQVSPPLVINTVTVEPSFLADRVTSC
ncbi:right-handed parallel beta-helix repeat-containing protein [Mycolicibacterium mengxianglii]|uniref:right-handed parallel beta-helix repeat-containing protein n=1 Tax=Mycolicibacterium mengxianglii TaxID=2736649 RepID=UPI0018D00E1B|nr:right-handed parallel beta-helix repeat-containing protein [Mycolicibacterium mengxianglii]